MEEELEDDDVVSKTVFYYAIQEGCDIEEAERVARAVAEAQAKKPLHRFKKWCLERIKMIGAAITTVITVGCIYVGEEAYRIVKNFFE